MRTLTAVALAGIALLLAFPTLAEEKPSIAVLDFSAKSGITQDVVDALADLVASAIQGRGEHKVIGKSDIQSMLGFEQVKDKLGCDDASCLAEIGGALGVDYILAGNIAKLGSMFLINMRLINPRKGEVAARASRQVSGGEEGLIQAVPHAVAELFGDKVSSAPTVSETRAQTSEPVASAPAEKQSELIQVQRALQEGLKDEHADYLKSEDHKKGVSFADFMLAKKKVRRDVGLVFALAVGPAFAGIGFAVGFTSFDKYGGKIGTTPLDETPGTLASIIIFSTLFVTSTIAGAVVAGVNGGDMDRIEALQYQGAASRPHRPVLVGVGLVPDSRGAPAGMALGFRF